MTTPSVQLWNATDGVTEEGKALLASLEPSTRVLMLFGPARAGKSLLSSAVASCQAPGAADGDDFVGLRNVFTSAGSAASVTKGVHGAHLPEKNLLLMDCEGLAALIGSADDQTEGESEHGLSSRAAVGVFAALSDGLVFVLKHMPDGDKVNMLSTVLFNRVSIAMASGVVDSSCVTTPSVLMAVRSHLLEEDEPVMLASRDRFHDAVVSKMLNVENASLEGRVKAHVMSTVDVGLIPQLKGGASKVDAGTVEPESWSELTEFCRTRVLSLVNRDGGGAVSTDSEPELGPLGKLERLMETASEGNALKEWGSSLSGMVGKVEGDARTSVGARLDRVRSGHVEDGSWLSGMKSGSFLTTSDLDPVRVWWSILVSDSERAERESELEGWVRGEVGQLEVDLMWKAVAVLQEAVAVFESHVVDPLMGLGSVCDVTGLDGVVEQGVEHMVKYASQQVGGLSKEHQRAMADLALATLWRNPDSRLQKAVARARSVVA